MGTSTNYGLPWPELTGTADGPAAFKSLAEAVDSQLTTFSNRFTGHACRLQSTTTQNIPNSTLTGITLQSAVLDRGGMASTSNSRINIIRDGYYYIRGIISYNYNNSGYRRAEILTNNTTVVGTDMRDPESSAAAPSTLTRPDCFAYLTAGTYLTLRAFQNSGVTIGVSGTATVTFGCDLIAFQIA